MPDALAVAGHWMAVAAGVLALVALVLPLPRLLRIRRRSRAVQARLAEAEARIQLSIAEIRAGREETERLLAPWRTTLKWATHPLTMALIRSYWRRWRPA